MEKSRQMMLLCILSVGLLFAGACSESGMSAEESAEIPAGTQLYVRVDDVTHNEGVMASSEFTGALERPIEFNGRMIVPAGAIVKGQITEMDASDESALGTTAAPNSAAPGAPEDRSEYGTARDERAGEVGSDIAGTDGRDRWGLELQSIVMDGKDYDIDTHEVPGPVSTEDMGTRGTNGERADAEKHAKMDLIRGKQFVFTLEDSVELPADSSASGARSE